MRSRRFFRRGRPISSRGRPESCVCLICGNISEHKFGFSCNSTRCPVCGGLMRRS